MRDMVRRVDVLAIYSKSGKGQRFPTKVKKKVEITPTRGEHDLPSQAILLHRANSPHIEQVE